MVPSKDSALPELSGRPTVVAVGTRQAGRQLYPGGAGTGRIDTHIHSAPDVVPRLLDDLEVATRARAAGYRAVVLKSHHSVTAARAQIVERAVGGVRVLGGVALNLHCTGGINVYAVDTAIRLGARIVWLPTFTSRNQVERTLAGDGDRNLRALGEIPISEAVAVLGDDGLVTDSLAKVLDLIAGANITLATGHLSALEIMTVVPEARRRGVQRIIVNHPELHSVALPVDMQLSLSQLGGVWFERVAVLTLPPVEYPVGLIAEAAAAVGFESTILASDLGQVGNPSPVDGMAIYTQSLMRCGVSRSDIELMTRFAPAQALGLD
ncbi:MAG: DUF6282 family protein [Candidatus Dormibacteria bacterium]